MNGFDVESDEYKAWAGLNLYLEDCQDEIEKLSDPTYDTVVNMYKAEMKLIETLVDRGRDCGLVDKLPDQEQDSFLEARTAWGDFFGRATNTEFRLNPEYLLGVDREERLVLMGNYIDDSIKNRRHADSVARSAYAQGLIQVECLIDWLGDCDVRG